jgi:uncharacterized protein (TIGR03118 family)
MRFNSRKATAIASLAVLVSLLPSAAFAQHYTQTNLVSNIIGLAPNIDPNLKNPWGLTRSADGSPWWVSNNNSGTSTLYDGSGSIIPAVFIVPPPKGITGRSSTPTGIVFNGSKDFEVAPGSPAIFIFVTEDGTISGWNPTVGDGTHAVLKVDNSDGGAPDSAVYKGATTAEIHAHRFLYVANFRSGKVEVYNSQFKRVHLGEDAFDDDDIPVDFAPFNVQNIGGSIVVTYARQDTLRHDNDEVRGGGYVDIFTASGKLIKRLQHGSWLQAPWGVVWTPRDFGEFSNQILVGNFGSGRIAAFDGFTGEFKGFMLNAANNTPLSIDGLWSLTFGNNGQAGSSTALFFSAGINHENDGLFGTLTPVAGDLDGDEE